MTIDTIKAAIIELVPKYNIKKVMLFGSRAMETHREDSDVDLIIEFRTSVSLLDLSSIKLQLEDKLKLGVDVIHGPIQDSDLLEIGKVIEIYAA